MPTILPQSVPRNDTQWQTFFNKLDTILGSTITDSTFINVKSYGAVGDNSTDDTTSFQAALADSANNILFVPPGTYKLSAQLSIPDAGVTIMGCGIGVSELRWTSGASTRGISITPDNAKQFVTVRDLRFTTAGTTGSALEIDCSQQIVNVGGGLLLTVDRVQTRVLVEACAFCGIDLVDSGDATTTAWVAAINIISAVGAVVRDCMICGLAATSTTGTTGYSGISFYGSPVTGNVENGHPVQLLVDNCTIWFCETGIQFLNCEGCYVSCSNVIACNWGIYVYSETHVHPQACIANSHCNGSIRPIMIDGMNQISISGCLLYGIQSAANAVLLEVGGGGNSGSIVGNTFVATSTNATGIAVSTYSHLAIANNSFVQVSTNMVTAIWITANATNCKEIGNIYNGTFTNKVLNSGGTTNKGVTEVNLVSY